MTDRASTTRWRRPWRTRLGRIDILAANAGIYPEALLEDIRSEQWDQMMDINVKGVLHSIQACLPRCASRPTAASC